MNGYDKLVFGFLSNGIRLDFVDCFPEGGLSFPYCGNRIGIGGIGFGFYEVEEEMSGNKIWIIKTNHLQIISL